MKTASVPEEKRVALDLRDVKDGIAENQENVRWVPTDHMLVDGLTKDMSCDYLLKYLKEMQYSLKYDAEIKDTKRAIQKERSLRRKQKQKAAKEDEDNASDI